MTMRKKLVLYIPILELTSLHMEINIKTEFIVTVSFDSRSETRSTAEKFRLRYALLWQLGANERALFTWSNIINSRWSDREEGFGVAQRGAGGRLATIGQEIKNAIKKRPFIVSFSLLSAKRDERRMESHEALSSH